MPFRVVRTITLDYADEDDFRTDRERWYLPQETKWGWFGPRKHFKHNVEIIGNVKDEA